MKDPVVPQSPTAWQSDVKRLTADLKTANEELTRLKLRISHLERSLELFHKARPEAVSYL